MVCGKAVVFPNTTVSSTNTTGGHEITEIFLKMTLRTYNPPSTSEVSTGDFLPPHPRPYHINRVLNQIGMNLTDLTLTNENNNMYALLCGGILVYLFNNFLLPYKTRQVGRTQAAQLNTVVFRYTTCMLKKVYVEQELLFTLLEHLSSHQVFRGIRVVRSLVFCVV